MHDVEVSGEGERCSRHRWLDLTTDDFGEVVEMCSSSATVWKEQINWPEKEKQFLGTTTKNENKIKKHWSWILRKRLELQQIFGFSFPFFCWHLFNPYHIPFYL